MKKLFYLILVLTLSAASLSSCTEDEVKPQADGTSAGGSPIKE